MFTDFAESCWGTLSSCLPSLFIKRLGNKRLRYWTMLKGGEGLAAGSTRSGMQIFGDVLAKQRLGGQARRRRRASFSALKRILAVGACPRGGRGSARAGPAGKGCSLSNKGDMNPTVASQSPAFWGPCCLLSVHGRSKKLEFSHFPH